MNETSHSGDPAQAGGKGEGLEFALQVREDRGALVLRDRTLFDWLRVERLEMEIPNVAFPLDLAGGAARFQRRRCRVTYAALAPDDRSLAGLARARAAALGAAGFEEVRVRALDGVIELSGRARAGDRSAEFAARAYVEPAGRAVRLAVAEARLFGWLRRPAPLVAHDLLVALVGAGEAGLDDAEAGRARVRGLADVEMAVLDALLWNALPPAGWRLPDASGVVVHHARVLRGRVEIVLAGGAPPPAPTRSHRAAAALDGAPELRVADDKLLRGDLDGAIAGYRGELARRQFEAPVAVERLLQVLVAQGGERRDAEELAKTALGRWPDFVPAHLALAIVAAERAPERAAEHFARVMELAEAAGDDEEAVRAGLAAARLLRDGDARRATPLYERVLDRRPGHPEAAEALAERYAAEERWTDLVRLLRRRVAATGDRREQARELTRLGEVLLSRLDDAERAGEEFERATRLLEGDARAWDGLGRARAALGDAAGAIRALDRVVHLLSARGDALGEARLHARIGALWETLDDDASAHQRYRRALELVPDDVDTLERLAVVASRRGRADEATECWGRVAELAGDDAELRRRAERELGRLLIESGDLDGARRVLEGREPDAERLALLATLEERAGRPDEAIEALARAAAAAAGGPRAAELELRIARLLDGLGRAADAVAAFERAQALAPDAPAGQEAARALVVAARRAGDRAAEVRWLDALIGAEPDAPDRGDLALRRAELHVEAGEHAAARALLEPALRQTTEPSRLRTLLAKVLLALGEPAAAAVMWEVLADELSAPAERADALAEGARARLESGDADGALLAARRAIALAPAHSGARRTLGEAAWRARAWDDVIAAYDALLAEAGAERAEMARRLGTALERHGREREAADAYRVAVEAPDAQGEPLAVSWRRLAELSERLGDPARAAAALAAAAADPRTGEPPSARAEQHYRAAEILRKKLGDAEGAARELEAALRADHEHMPALDALEALHADAGDHERVAAILGRKIAATARHPERRKALLARLAELQRTVLGRPDVAREAYRRALELDPDYRPALRFLARDARERGDRDEARAALERLAAAGPEGDGAAAAEADPEAAAERAWALAELAALAREEGRPDEAVARLEAAVALAPGRQELLVGLEELHAEAGRWADVARALARRIALVQDGPDRVALEARRISVLAEHAGDPAAALEASRAALARAPEDLRLLTLCAAAARIVDAPRDLAEAQERLGALLEDPAARREALLEAARIRRRLGEPERARALLEAVLELDERDAAALAQLAELARARGDLADADAFLGRLQALEPDPRRRAALGLERARALLDADDADGAFAAIADLPRADVDPELLLLRADLEEERTAWREAAADLAAVRERAEAWGDVELERLVARRLAALTLERLRDERAAEKLYERALAIDVDDVASAEALAQISERRREPERTLAALARVLEIVRRTRLGAARELEVLREIVRVARRAGNVAAARDRLDEALALAPDEPRLWRERAEVAATLGDFADCARCLERLAAMAPREGDGRRQDAAELLVELADVYEARLRDFDRARDALVRAAEVCPPGARREALLRRCAGYAVAAGDHAQAAQAIERLPEAARTAADWIAAARAYVRLGRDADAIRAFESAQDAADLDETEALELFALYQKANRARDLAAALERTAARAAPEQAAKLLREALALYEGALADTEAAARVRARLLPDGAAAATPPPAPPKAPPPAPPMAPELGPAELLALARAAADLTEGRELARRAAAAFEPADGRAEALRLAAERSRDLGDAAGEETDLAALRGAGLALSADLVRLAALLEEREALEDAAVVLAEAITAHARRLGTFRQPLDDLGRDLLVRLRAAARASRRFAPLADGLVTAAAVEPDAATAAEWLSEAAAVRRAHLGDATGAADALMRALALRPGDPALVRDLDALLRELGDFARLIDVWDLHLATLRDVARAPALYELGRVWADAFGEPSRAAVYFAQAHVVDPSFAPVLLPLADFHHAEGELDPADDYYRRALESGAVAPEERASVLARLGELALKRGDAAGAIAWLGEALGADPMFPAAWAWLEHALRAADDWDGLVELLLARGGLEVTPEDPTGWRAQLASARALAQMEGDAEERLVRLREAAALLDGPLGRTEDAVPAYGVIAALDPSDELAAARFAAAEAVRSRDSRTVSGEIVVPDPPRPSAPEPPPEPAAPATPSWELELRKAAEEESQGRADRAIAHYENAWAEAPTDPRPLAGLRRLAEAREDWDYVAELLGRQILQAADPPARARLWFERALLYRDVLGREPEAYRCLKEAVANDPTLVAAAHALRAMAIARSEWALVAELLHREMASAEDAAERAALHVELGLVYEERFFEIESAIRNYETALELDPTGPVPPTALARLYALVRRFDDAARAEERLAERQEAEGARAEHLLRAGEHWERAGNVAEAQRLYRLAARLGGGADAASAAMEKLNRLAGAAPDPDKLRALLEARLAETQDAAERLAILKRLLNLAMGAGDDAMVEQRARDVLARDPADLTAFLERRRILQERENWPALVELYRARAEIVSEPEERAGLYFELGRLIYRRLGDQTRAALAFEEALRADPTHPAALDALADIAYRQHDWERARTLYLRLEPASSSFGRDVVMYRRGELAEVMGFEAEAEEGYRAAIAANPSHMPAHEALARLALYRGELNTAIDALKGVLDLLPLDDVDRITAVRQQLGELCHRAGDVNQARLYYELVLAEDSARVAALIPLAEIYANVGEWNRAAEILSRLSLLVTTPEKRADLLYRTGEIYRIHLGDEDRASDAYLKAIDLDPKHAGTMRRLIDYYWSVGDRASLDEIASELEGRAELCVEDTPSETLARVAVTAALAGDARRAQRVSAYLGTAGAGALAATLADAASRRPDLEDALVRAARVLCVPPGPTLLAVKEVLDARGPKDPAAASLAFRLDAR